MRTNLSGDSGRARAGERGDNGGEATRPPPEGGRAAVLASDNPRANALCWSSQGRAGGGIDGNGVEDVLHGQKEAWT